jgi:hypothetical protein
VIFTSLGLLLVALGFLLAGIAKSSVALLMVSLFVTLGAGIVLILVSAAARQIVAATGGGVGVARQEMHPVVIDLREEQAAATAAAANGRAPVVGYDDMTAEQVMKLIRSGALGQDQLSSVRDYEAAHQGRKTVLDRLDRELKAVYAGR